MLLLETTMISVCVPIVKIAIYESMIQVGILSLRMMIMDLGVRECLLRFPGIVLPQEHILLRFRTIRAEI